ncbi:sulfite exporter TauE/SafE family protein [Acidimangrovimonas sediminis]|uniref:sulfite exporter TauE/SafE family protein n=1 Tax=Acidimangrovimonas sediminis TaxID=2056283 RepID=UPI000C80E793|nr:sulfite exporter TauE/SafE family protein [Acidimangrovimonas sediminis]
MLSALSGGLGPAQLGFVLAVAAIAGLSRGFSGFGAALIFMPLASAIVGPKVAAPLLLIVDAVAALSLLPDAWRRADKARVFVMAGGAAIGVPLGTAALIWLDRTTMRWLISGVTCALLALLISGWRYHGRPRPWATVLVGTASGLFSGAAGAGGPPVIAYWLGSPEPRAAIRANIVAYFAVSTVLSIISYSLGGLFTWHVLALCLPVGLAYALGLQLGARLFRLAGDAGFRWVSYALIAGAGIGSLPLFDHLLR